MRVLFIIYGSMDQVSGGYLYDRMVSAGLLERGVHVDILELEKPPYLLSPFQSLSSRIRRVFRKDKYRDDHREAYDFIILDELVHPSLCFALPRKRRGAQVVVTLLHHLKSEEPILPLLRPVSSFLEKTLLVRSDLVIANSHTTSDTVRRLAGSKIPVCVCAPGNDALVYDTGSLNQKCAAGDPVRILSVGNLIPRKGFHLLIRALKRLKPLTCTLTIAGDTDTDRGYTRRIERMIERFGLAGAVTLTGAVPDDTLISLYRSSHIFVLPSRYEGYGIVLAEALYFGLPYIAFDSGAIGEVVGLRNNRPPPAHDNEVRDGITRTQGGYLVLDNSIEALARGLRIIIDKSAGRAQLEREARALGRSLPSWEETGRCFYETLTYYGTDSGRKKAE